MTNLIIAPVLLPAVIGALIILWMRGDLLLQRVFSIAGTVLLLAVSLWLLGLSLDGQVRVYRLGNWAAPFGIVLMLDRLAGVMLVLASTMALAVQVYAFGSGWDRKGWHFHALWQFQLMGICGAFLTGDAFNLFVFFEILLIASYGLMTHGGGGMRLRAGVQYIAYNLAGSVLFLAALGVLYAVTGTLNMADMAARVAAMPPQDTALLRTGAVMLMLVFAIKAALVPLHFWLPSTYANAPGPVAALFAILTKVGVYAIIRFGMLVFPQDAVTEGVIMDLLLPAALFTLAVGQVGVLGSRNLGRLAAFATIGSVGTLMIAVAQFTPQGIAAALFYTVHSTLAAAALFLVVDMIGARRGDLWLRDGPRLGGLVAGLFFVTAIAVVGMPPLSGFLGKLMVLDATRDAPMVWAVVLLTSLIAIYGMARAGSLLFWKSSQPALALAHDGGGPLPKLETHEPVQDLGDAASPALAATAVAALLAGLVALTVFAGPAMELAQDTAAQLADPDAYIRAVLTGQEGTK